MKFCLFLLFVFQSAHAAFLTDLARIGVKPVVKKLTHARLQQLSETEDRYLLDVQFGVLTAAQYGAIRDQLKSRTQVPFVRGQSYSLVDFLPPFAQATVNHVVLTRSLDTEPLRPLMELPEEEMDGPFVWFMVKNGIAHYTNCWNTSMQLVRSLESNSVSLYWPGRWEADGLMKDDQKGRKIAPNQAGAGDVMLISAALGTPDPMLQHTAWLVSDDVVFEKTDTSENDPYRLSLKSDVLKKYRRLLGADLKIEYRRYGKNAFGAPAPLDLPAKVETELKKVFPDRTKSNLTYGCETGMGGGCDGVVSIVEDGQLGIERRTGRGTITLSPEFRTRFVKLR